MKQLTEKQKKDRKFLLALPILTLPFLCLAFWSMGGGKDNPTDTEELQQGLNMTLPEAQIEAQNLNKLESYEQAEKKASKILEQRRMDPFANTSTKNIDLDTLQSLTTSPGRERTLQKTEDEVKEKLFALETLLNQPDIQQETAGQQIPSVSFAEASQANYSNNDAELQRLESLMASVIDPEKEDPEMERIDSMLDKLLDVQHPQRVHERLSQTNQLNRKVAFKVSLNRNSPQEENFKESTNSHGELNGFYTLDSDRQQSFATIRPAISAQVTKDQEVVTGASIEMELTQTVFIEGVEFLAGTQVTGICTLIGERLNIEVQRIRSGNLIIPVSMEVMDLDALPGIKIPNAITREAVKQGAGDGIQSMNMMGMSSSWEAQASMAGMETVKSILSKKAKLVKVTVKAGHPLLLADLSAN